MSRCEMRKCEHMAYDNGWFVREMWSKASDITAKVIENLVSALLIAVTAYLTWTKKKQREHRLELQHRRDLLEQDRQFAAEVAKEASAKHREHILNAWKADIFDFQHSVNRDSGLYSVQELRDTYIKWMRDNRLVTVGDNKALVNQWAIASFQTNHPMPSLDRQALDTFLQALSYTQLPAITDNKFPWSIGG